MSEVNEQVLRNLRRLQRIASEATRNLIDQVIEVIIPIPIRHGFAVSPDYLDKTKNEFGPVWGSNEIPFQDRTAGSWPTIVVRLDRDLSPTFRIELCTVPDRPMMVDGHALPRNEANCGHSVRLLYLRKGRSSSYWDHHFGSRLFACFKSRQIHREVLMAASLLERVVSVSERGLFLEKAEAAVGKQHVYESWNENSPDRPNKSR